MMSEDILRRVHI